MKGLPGRSMRGLPTKARLICADNTGARIVEIVTVPRHRVGHRRYPAAGIGDLMKVTVKKGNPETRRQLFDAVVIRQKRPFRRPDGTMVMFEDNAAVLTTPTGETKGSDIKGPVAREAAERWPRIAANARIIV